MNTNWSKLLSDRKDGFCTMSERTGAYSSTHLTGYRSGYNTLEPMLLEAIDALEDLLGHIEYEHHLRGGVANPSIRPVVKAYNVLDRIKSELD